MFRAVFKQDRHGNCWTTPATSVPPIESDPGVAQKMAQGVAFQGQNVTDHPPAGVPVHLKDIHLERGMQCVDCHFEMDTHGNGNLYGETRNAVHVQCEDCHGTTEHRANFFSYLLLREGIEQGSAADKDRYIRDAMTGTATRGKTPEQQLKDNRALVEGQSVHFKLRRHRQRTSYRSAPPTPRSSGASRRSSRPPTPRAGGRLP